MRISTVADSCVLTSQQLLVTGDRELLESLMFDAEATRFAMSSWLKENVDDTPNGGTFRKSVEVA